MMSLQAMVAKQVERVITRGQRATQFDRLRSRHFWSSYLFVADPNTNLIQAGQYDIFKAIPSSTGQGYPTNVPLTLRETNWLNAGRVPDNQNFVITEIGVTLKRPPSVDNFGLGTPSFAPSNGIFANLPSAQQTYIAGTDGASKEVNPLDAIAILYGATLEMSFLTNNVPLGLLADFSQSAGNYSFQNKEFITSDAGDAPERGGDPLNGVPAAAFRRKLEVPILLQHGENMGMRINIPRNIEVQAPNSLTSPGSGWFEIRVDWWAHESFVDLS